ncbi:SH3 domain-containing protein [Jannaschia pohangensis]|uniref:SH3-like domain-containing protein n=1 Tax=Jannaschia pohangensis TaxID=390807 RepID=A0A1I3QB82_9RHOB|nr:SH3 domain-containing protein [Jannaschia pohangensis]SFJ30571.1 SH3-like domain-containing protein [Jannaschia pohangensis]
MRFTMTLAALAACFTMSAPAPGQAQTATPAVTPVASIDTGETLNGSVTGLPLPRFVSMKAAEGFARRGPSSTHRIDWVFKRRHMPLVVTDEYGHWRRVQDRDGAGGWMHYSLLSGNRTVIVEQDDLHLRRSASADARVIARLQAGVVAWLGECHDGWCALDVRGTEGWAPISALWGVEPDEARD